MDVSATVEGRLSDDEDRNVAMTNGFTKERSVAGDKSHPNGSEHQFQKAISAWRNIDLGKVVPELDSTASDIIANQRDALVQRKDLAQKTKDFRKLDDQGKLAEYKTLLKSYQTFIDLLTTHGKTTSSAFLQLYSTISEAPDPYPLLEASVDSLLVSEETLPKLTAENGHLQQTVAELSSQLEITENGLDAERRKRKELEDSQEAKAKEIEASWQAVTEEKRYNWESKERTLEERVENQERLLNEIKASYEVSQRLGQDDSNGTEARQASASAAELEIVSSDLERTSSRLAEIEARNEQLRVELAQASSTAQSRHAEEDPDMSRLRSENASLMRKVESTRLDKDAETRKWETRIRTLERETETLQRDRENLRDRLQQWRDYDDLKRDVEVFKSIEFSTGDDDESNVPVRGHSRSGSRSRSIDYGNDGSSGGSKRETLEQLLLARNKKLSNDMATLRVSHQDLQHRINELQSQTSITNAELERSQSLNVTLENDLTKLQQEASNAFPSSAMSSAGTYTSRYPANSFPSRRGRSSPTSSIISGFDSQLSPQSTMEAIRAGEPVGGGFGILPMVQAQRDRFKQKNAQLEEDLSKQYNTVSSLRQEVSSLQKDNLNLYEKTRYISTYNRGGHHASSASAYSQNPPTSSVQVSDDTSSGLSVDRYRSAYEANISPFQAFRGRESTRAYKRMSLPERMVFSITRLVLANRTSRNIFAGYCVALHVLIFLMLYWMQTADVQRHASSLGEAVDATLAGGVGTEAHHGEWHQEGFAGGEGT